MRALKILVEGPTELGFVNNSICPYFNNLGIYNIRPITIETRPGFKGGDVRYEARYKANILRLLRETDDMVVTSLIDYYRLRTDFPNYQEAQQQPTPEQKVSLIEQGCADDIADARFIPYIQLHEFEGLLFTSMRGFQEYFPNLPGANLRELQHIINAYPNPELINDQPNTAPSKRLDQLIPDYRKPLHGNIIALENGFDNILNRCPRFNTWIETLVERMQAP